MNIWDAARNGDIKRIDTLIKEGVNIDSTDPEYGSTPLMFAAQNSNSTSSLETVKFLLDRGADVNFKNKNSNTALILSADLSNTTSSLETVKMLLDRGADPNVKNKNGSTVLIILVWKTNSTSSLETVKLLLDRGADINLENDNGWTPLSLAASYSNTTGSLETVKLLLDRGADVNFKTKTGWTALMDTVKNSDKTGSLNAIKLLLKYGADPFEDIKCPTDECSEIIEKARWERLSNRDKQMASKYNQQIPISKDVWLIIMRHKRQQQLCSNLSSNKNKDLLKYFALELEIPLEQIQNMTKGQLCGIVSKQISYRDYNKLSKEYSQDITKLLVVARSYGIDVSKPLNQIMNDLAIIFQ